MRDLAELNNAICILFKESTTFSSRKAIHNCYQYVETNKKKSFYHKGTVLFLAMFLCSRCLIRKHYHLFS